MQDYEPKKQTIDFYILFNPDTEWRKTFGVFYAFFGTGGWFGVTKSGQGWDEFISSKLCKSINADDQKVSI